MAKTTTPRARFQPKGTATKAPAKKVTPGKAPAPVKKAMPAPMDGQAKVAAKAGAAVKKVGKKVPAKKVAKKAAPKAAGTGGLGY